MLALDSSKEAQILLGEEGMSAPTSFQTGRVTLRAPGSIAVSDHSGQDVTVADGSLVSDGGEEVDCIGAMISMGLSVVGGSLCWAQVVLAPAAPIQVETMPVATVDDSRCWDGDVDQQNAHLRRTPSPPPGPHPPVRSRRLGSVPPHVRFLQHLFRSCRRPTV